MSVTTLLEYFQREAGVPVASTPRPVAEEAVAREALAALLTVRPPAPLPEEIAAELDELLEREVSDRGVTAADALPLLSVTHGVPGILGERVALWRGDLTTLAADGIVNAANSRMLGCFDPAHPCVDNAIHAVAGPALRLECAEHMRRQGHPEPTGTVTVTGGHHLPARHVLHTVGPIVRGSPTPEDAALLASCYRSVLDAAEDRGMHTVGFCSVSTGAFGYPKPEAARVVLEVLERWLQGHPRSALRIVLCAFSDSDERACGDALRERLARASRVTEPVEGTHPHHS